MDAMSEAGRESTRTIGVKNKYRQFIRPYAALKQILANFINAYFLSMSFETKWEDNCDGHMKEPISMWKHSFYRRNAYVLSSTNNTIQNLDCCN